MRRRGRVRAIGFAALTVLGLNAEAAAQPPPNPPPPAPPPATEPPKPSPPAQPNPTAPVEPPALAEQRATTAPADAPAVPDWARDVTWYYLDVPRFRNGSKDNDPPDTRPWTQPLVAADAPWEDTFKTAALSYGGDLQGVREKLAYIKELGFGAICLARVFADNPQWPAPLGSTWHVSPDVGLPDPPTTAASDPSPAESWTAGDRLLLDLIREAHAAKLRVVIEIPLIIHRPQGVPHVLPENWRPPLSVDDAIPQMVRWLKPVMTGITPDALDGFMIHVDENHDEAACRRVLSAVADANRNAVVLAAPWSNLRISESLRVFPVLATVELQPDTRLSFETNFPYSSWARHVEKLVASRRSNDPAVFVNTFSSVNTGRMTSRFPPPQPDSAESRQHRLRALRAWRLTLALTLCLPHSVMLMYGDEVGMTGAHSDAALAPMWWIEPGRKDAPSPDYRADYRALVRLMNDLRARYEPLRRGDFKLVLADDDRRIFAFSRSHEDRTVIVVVNASDERREAVLEPGLVEADMVAVVRPELEPLIPRSQQTGIDPLRPVLVEPKLRLAGNRTLADSAGRISINLDPMSLKLVLVGPEWAE